MSVADAYVDLHVNGDHIDGEVRSSVREAGPGAERESDRVGSRSGDRFGSGFLKGFKKRFDGDKGDFGKKLKGAFEGLNPASLKIPALAAALPFLTSGVSALSGALVAFTGAVVQAGGASASLVGVLGGLVQAKMIATLAFKDFGKAAAGNDKALAALGANGKAAAKAFGELGKAGGGFKKSISERVFSGLDSVITKVGKTTVPMLRNQFGKTGTQVNFLVKDLARFATSSNGINKIKTAVAGNTAIFATLRKAAVPALKGILNIYAALLPSSGRLADKIVQGAEAFRAWSAADGRMEKIDHFMRNAFASAHNLWSIVKNLGKTLYNVFSAATPAGNGILVTFTSLTKRLADFTSLASTKNAIAEWAQKGIDFTGRLFSGLGKGFMLIKGLFNPDLASGYLDVFAAIIPIIMSVVKVVQSALAPVIKSIGAALAENGPKFAGLFKALAPLLAGVGAVIGQIISQSLDMLGTIAAVITPVVRIISNILGPVMVKFAPIIAAVILAFTNWGGAIVKMIPYVGKFLGPLVELASWITGKIGPAILRFGKVIGFVFKFIARIIGAGSGAASRFVAGHFTLIKTIISTTMRVIQRVVSVGWRIIKAVFGAVIRPIVAVVRTYFNIMRAIITGVFRVVRTVITGAWKVIRAVVGAGARFVRSIIGSQMNAAKAIFSRAWGAIKGAAGKVWGGIKAAVSGGIRGVVALVKKFPGKILSLAGAFLNAGRNLGKKVMSGIGHGLSAVGGLGTSIASAVKHAINSALHLPVTIKGPGPLPDFTIPAFARGTNYAPGGMALVGERGPELVNLPRGSQVKTAAQTRALQNAGPSLPKRIVLRIGGRDFVAFVEEIADGRIDAAESLAGQGF